MQLAAAERQLQQALQLVEPSWRSPSAQPELPTGVPAGQLLVQQVQSQAPAESMPQAAADLRRRVVLQQRGLQQALQLAAIQLGLEVEPPPLVPVAEQQQLQLLPAVEQQQLESMPPLEPVLSLPAGQPQREPSQQQQGGRLVQPLELPLELQHQPRVQLPPPGLLQER